MNSLIKTLSAALLAFASLAAWAAVDVNKASQADLETVAGVGPAMSTRILDERKKAAFNDWPDMISRVKGVGPSNATKFSNSGMTVNGAPYKAEPVNVASAKAAKGAAAPDKPVVAKRKDEAPTK